MSLPALEFGDLVATLPIIQGGMGIGISMHRLASAVAAGGGIGVISTAGIAFDEPDVIKNKDEANQRALACEIRKARELSEGIIGVNVMGVLQDFAVQVRTAISEKIDVIFSGSSLPLDLPKYLQDLCEEKQQQFHTKLVPILSSARAASIVCRKWLSRFDYLPDGIVIEGPKAGGHLGFKPEEIDNPEFALEKLIPATVEAMKPFEDKAGRKVPVIAAGGVFNGEDVYNIMELGASGVQLGTRFVATEECDADHRFKQAYIDARSEDAVIIKSPVGLPGRALGCDFLKRLNGHGELVACKFSCISTCDPSNAPYCISSALRNAMCGKLESGFVFCGSNVGRVEAITTVAELLDSIKQEYESAKAGFFKVSA